MARPQTPTKSPVKWQEMMAAATNRSDMITLLKVRAQFGCGRSLSVSTLLWLSLFVLPAAAAPSIWKPAPGPLMTRWAKDVSPTNALPDYPRPQMVRHDWRNLNGLWQFSLATTSDTPPIGRALPGQILVPYPVESALSGVMKHQSRVWYRRHFQVPAAWKGRHVLLHFGAVDWEANVYLNGHHLGTHRGGYDAFSYDITGDLRPGELQELVVGVFDPTDAGNQPRGKQVNKPGGIFYTPTTGIWQTVWLEPVAPVHISDLLLTPDVDHSSLLVTAPASGTGSVQNLKVKVTAVDHGRVVGRASGAPGAAIRVRIPHPHLWWPSDPHLYTLKVALSQNGRVLDYVRSYFGMRKISLGMVGGVNRILLNGKPLFETGVLDQGFWPDGIYTAPTDAALRYDIEMEKKLGFNMARKHVKVEPARWYYWADRLGLLVWQDMPAGDNRTPESKVEFERELRRMIAGRRNHPCIVMWVVFNEGWGQFDTERLTRLVQKLDPSRLVDDASGWTDKGVGSVLDSHSYPNPGSPHPGPTRAAVDGEFGGLGLGVNGHSWSGKHWGYQGMASSAALTGRYRQLLRQVWRLKGSPGISACVYTQITDVETESNGLMTYDRAVVKVDIPTVAAANEGHFPPVTTVVPTAQRQPVLWRYTTAQPPADWMQPGFDDSGWKTGPAGFGTAGTPGAVVRTEWNTPDIWIRRTFTLPAGSRKGLEFMVHHDEDVQIYLNGVLAASETGYISDYEELPMTPAGRAALRPGINTLAVHCHQTTGGQYADVGMVRDGPG